MSEGLLKTAVGVPWNLGLLSQETSDTKPSLDPTCVSQRRSVETGLSCCPLFLSSGHFLEGTHLRGQCQTAALPCGPQVQADSRPLHKHLHKKPGPMGVFPSKFPSLSRQLLVQWFLSYNKGKSRAYTPALPFTRFVPLAINLFTQGLTLWAPRRTRSPGLCGHIRPGLQSTQPWSSLSPKQDGSAQGPVRRGHRGCWEKPALQQITLTALE